MPPADAPFIPPTFRRAALGLGLAWGTAAIVAASPPSALVFGDLEPGGRHSLLVRDIASLARGAGYDVALADGAFWATNGLLAAPGLDLLILTDGRRLPAELAAPMEAWLRQGGDLLALGLPLWEDARFRVQGRWMSRSEYSAALASVPPQRILEDFDAADLSLWSRATDQSRHRVRHELVPSDRGKALHVAVEQVTGWETFQGPPLTAPFRENHTLTCFRARGDDHTRQLLLEWTERDGSRWLATVELTNAWRQYVLPPAAFKAWEPKNGRGGAGDRFQVAQAARFTVGLAHSHMPLPPGLHAFWIDDLGTASDPLGGETPPAEFAPPRLESLSPGYQCFPIAGPALVLPSHDKAALDDWEQPTNAALAAFTPAYPLRGLHPRPRGLGFNQDRPWRWEPLLGAYLRVEPGAAAENLNANYGGALGALLVQASAPYRGGVWAGFTPAEPAFYRQPLVRQIVAQTLRRMQRGWFLLEAGSERFVRTTDPAYQHLAPAHPIVGARVANFGRESAGPFELRYQWPITPPFPSCLPLSKAAAGEVVAAQITDLLHGTAVRGEDAVAFRLHLGSADDPGTLLVDAVLQPILFADPPASSPFVEARGGRLSSHGRPWRAHGVNYMPSSGIAQASGDYFEHWLGRGAYDPSVIQRDLERIRGMGLNAVSAFIYHRSLGAGHLFDFLLRCERLGLRVNLSLRPGTPMDFRWSEMKALIEHYRLASNATVMAYDLAWEPSHYDEAFQRRHYGKPWTDWVLARHGSIARAQARWEHAAPIAQATGTTGPATALEVPPAAWLTHDGPWRKIVADYRRFLDEWVGRHYAEARRLVRTIDGNHLVSFRMQMSGDPTHNAPGLLPYDFKGLAAAVDLWEPEAYGRIGDWERVKAGRFTADYARLWNPALPVVWAEMGYDTWDRQTMAPGPEKLAFADRYYRDFYRMLRESGADGIFFWWYPGGYRLNEQSDYGIIHPDGTDREVTRVIREEGPAFLAAPAPPPPDHWIEVDRDRDARGLAGIYEAVQADYWRAIAEGRQPGLKVAPTTPSPSDPP